MRSSGRHRWQRPPWQHDEELTELFAGLAGESEVHAVRQFDQHVRLVALLLIALLGSLAFYLILR